MVADVFLYVGAGGGCAFVVRAAFKVLSKRAYQADYRRAEQIASAPLSKAYSEHISDLGNNGPSFAERCAVLGGNIDIADLALIDRYSYQTGFKYLVGSRKEEIAAWRAKRRRQPLLRLFASVRSATVG